jgi:Phytanoyl-CoA dioxygenase (PhyH)
MRQIFNDPELNRSYLESGFVVIDILTSDQILALQQLYDQEKFPPTGNFYLTIWKDEPSHRLEVHNKIQKIIEPSYRELLHRYKPIISSFAVKLPKPDSSWHPHQDDTFVDEKNFVSLSIWIPLVDTNVINGTVCVLPGSHLVFIGPRSPNIPQPFKGDLEKITGELINVDLKLGQALVFDHRLIHGSNQNSSDKERVAVVTVLIPEEADLTYVYLDTDSKPKMIKEYVISEKYYLEAPLGEFSKEPDPKEFRLVASYPYIETSQA